MKYSETSDGLSITNAMPSTGPDETKHFDFTIEGRNKYSKPIWYEIVLSQGEEDASKTRLKDEFLRFRLVEINGEERKVVLDNASYSDLEKGQRIWVNTIDAKTDNVEIKYELYMWIGFETKIGNTEGNDYTMDEWKDVYASIKVSVNGDFEEKKVLPQYPAAAQKVLSRATENDYIIDEDDVLYFSGTNEEIDFNYVWYSGKLWRITSINPDGTMKLVTQDEITAISWGSNTIYSSSSWIYQWLNEDFKDTLYNYENIIDQDASWNASEDGTSTSSNVARPSTDSTATIVKGDVGLLNLYEYYQSYKNTNYSNGYLNIGYYWWLITPKDSSSVWYVSYSGNFQGSFNYPGVDSFGVRPSINLKSNIGIVAGGDGSETNPYRINGDKEQGNNGELINTRLSGEYVEADSKVYRIVGIETDGTTKLTSVDYVRDDGGTVLTKNFSSDYKIANYGTVVSNGTDDVWGYYLNNTWLTSELENYITDGTYYLGQVGPLTSRNYKNAICSASNTRKTTSSCEKTTSKWQGLVGLPRIGEMFSAMLGKGYNDTSTYIWLITPENSSSVISVYHNGYLNSSYPSSNAYGVRPSINLKSEVIITGGDGMSEETAYTIGLPE